MEPQDRWSEIVSELSPEDKDLLFGTSLSRRFSRLPLWISHPANIGMFYGFLISLALIFPYILRYDNLNESFFELAAVFGFVYGSVLFSVFVR